MPKLCGVTIDVHESDQPDWIARSADALSAGRFFGTYFVPTSLLRQPSMKTALQRVIAQGHEVGTHSHQHDTRERLALSAKHGASLDFLTRSARDFADTFGRDARSFRSPCWCGLSEAALDQLALLGYTVDSSSTPQRLGLLSSAPFENPWLFSARAPTFLRPTLLEIPSTSFIVPFGRMLLGIARLAGSRGATALFAAEAMFTAAVVTIQLHPSDFFSDQSHASTQRRPALRDLVPRRGRGILARHWLADLDPLRLSQRVWAVLNQLRNFEFEFATLQDISMRVAEWPTTSAIPLARSSTEPENTARARLV